VQILGGTRATAMQSLQLHLTGAARSWLSTLPNNSIGNWGELESQFTRNFRSTYKRPASLEKFKSCIQRKDETLRSYIQRWSIIKNSAEDISDERAVDAFLAGLRRSDLIEELGRTKPRIVLELMGVQIDSPMEKIRTTTKGCVHQKSTEQAGKGEGLAMRTAAQGETR
jgi:hypothetical protein